MLPIKQVKSTFAPATSAPIQITLVAVVTSLPARLPKAVLLAPLVSKASASTPVAVLALPMVLATSALTPMAVLLLPVVLLWREPTPLAVLLLPSVLLRSARSPVAVLKLPAVLLKRANVPLAVFWKPVVLLKSAPAPAAVFSSAVLPPGKAVSGAAGSIACAFGKKPKQTSASVIRSNGVALLSSIVDIIIMVLSLFPAADSLIAGLKRAKNRTGRGFLGPSQTYLRRVLRNPR